MCMINIGILCNLLQSLRTVRRKKVIKAKTYRKNTYIKTKTNKQKNLPLRFKNKKMKALEI